MTLYIGLFILLLACNDWPYESAAVSSDMVYMNVQRLLWKLHTVENKEIRKILEEKR